MDVLIPETLWNEEGEGSISSWFFSDGDIVAEGDLLAEIMVEKTAYELTAPTGGRLSLLVPADQPVSKGALVARIA